MAVVDAFVEYIQDAPEMSAVPGVADVVERSVLDSLGVALHASTGEMASALIRALALDTGTNRVIGRRERLASSSSVLVNGALIHAEDWDDMGGSGGHPSAALIPPLLALAETHPVSGADFIDAYACGYQVGTVLARSLTGDSLAMDRPWHPSAVVGPLAASAAASRLLRLDADQSANALAIASSFSGGFLAQFGTWAKPLQLGKAASAGYLSALLAREGFAGDREFIERPNGFAACFAPGASWRYMKHDLAGPLFLTSTDDTRAVGFGIHIKPWPWCGGANPAVTALEQILEAHRINWLEVESVLIEEPVDRTKGSLFRSADSSVGLHGKFSVAYNVIARLLYPEAMPLIHTNDIAREIHDTGLISRTETVVGKPFGHSPPTSRVTLRLHDGREFSGVSDAHGRELAGADVTAKFRAATAQVVELHTAEMLIAAVTQLRSATEVGALLWPIAAFAPGTLDGPLAEHSAVT